MKVFNAPRYVSAMALGPSVGLSVCRPISVTHTCKVGVWSFCKSGYIYVAYLYNEKTLGNHIRPIEWHQHQ